MTSNHPQSEQNLSLSIASYGVSSSFRSLMLGIRETTGLSEKKFRPEDVNKVAQYLVCRNYGKACLELSYLLWAVVNYPCNSTNTSLLKFFWLDENITPSLFRQSFAIAHKEPNLSIEMLEFGLSLSLNQKAFVISPTRVGTLAVLLEFITTIAPEQLQIFEKKLKYNSVTHLQNETVIKSLSSDLQKIIYKYLGENLIQAQQQRRFRYVTQWLDNKNQETPKVSLNILSDENILNFWQEASLDPTAPGFKLFSSALFNFIDVHEAIQQAKNTFELEHANSIGFDQQAGEYSPDIIKNLLFEEDTEQRNYVWLCQSPKFLTKAQWGFIEPIMQHQKQAANLCLSFARLATFGQWQNNLIQAKRKSLPLVLQKLTEQPQLNYRQFQQQISAQLPIYHKVVLAVIHILYSHEDSRYLGFAKTYCSRELVNIINKLIEKSSDMIISEFNKNPALSIEELNKKSFRLTRRLLIESEEFQALLLKSQKIFSGNNKEGFRQLPSIESLDIYQDGAEGVILCSNLVNKFCKQFDDTWINSQGCLDNFSSDTSIFKSTFEKIYGEDNEL